MKVEVTTNAIMYDPGNQPITFDLEEKPAGSEKPWRRSRTLTVTSGNTQVGIDFGFVPMIYLDLNTHGDGKLIIVSAGISHQFPIKASYSAGARDLFKAWQNR